MRGRLVVTVSTACTMALLIINSMRGQGSSTVAPNSNYAADMMAAVAVDHCNRLFIDGGSNMGEAVSTFLKGGFFQCALTGPPRIYASRWQKLSSQQRKDLMAPLAEPATFCVRSFEAAPSLLAPLRAQETTLRKAGRDVLFIDGALSNATAALAPREIVTYGPHPQAESAMSFRFDDVHVAPGGIIKPKALRSRTVMGPSYSLVELLERTLRRNASSIIAIRLDVEGAARCRSARRGCGHMGPTAAAYEITIVHCSQAWSLR